MTRVDVLSRTRSGYEYRGSSTEHRFLLDVYQKTFVVYLAHENVGRVAVPIFQRDHLYCVWEASNGEPQNNWEHPYHGMRRQPVRPMLWFYRGGAASSAVRSIQNFEASMRSTNSKSTVSRHHSKLP